MAIKREVPNFVEIDPYVALEGLMKDALERFKDNPAIDYFAHFDKALEEAYPHIHEFTDNTAGLDPYHGKYFNGFLGWFLDGAEGVDYGDQ